MTNPYSIFAGAIGNAEGFGVPGTIPTLRNNPGDLTDPDGNILSFGSPAEGETALENQLHSIFNGTSSHYSPNESLSQMAETYAGGGQGSKNWLSNVSSKLGVSPDSSLTKILGSIANIAAGQPDVAGLAGGVGKSISSDIVSSILSSRIAFFLLGMILIAGGIFMLKQTRSVITVATKAAVKGAEIAA